jgi:hypothetical protein
MLCRCNLTNWQRRHLFRTLPHVCLFSRFYRHVFRQKGVHFSAISRMLHASPSHSYSTKWRAGITGLPIVHFVHPPQILKSRCGVFSRDWWRTYICPSFDKVSVIHVVFLECYITFGKSKILVIHCNIFNWQGDVMGEVVVSCVKFDLYESWKTVRKCSGPILKQQMISERPKWHHEGRWEIDTCKI